MRVVFSPQSAIVWACFGPATLTRAEFPCFFVKISSKASKLRKRGYAGRPESPSTGMSICHSLSVFSFSPQGALILARTLESFLQRRNKRRDLSFRCAVICGVELFGAFLALFVNARRFDQYQKTSFLRNLTKRALYSCGFVRHCTAPRSTILYLCV